MQQSYFALFELEPRFALPLARLDLAYRALAARVHPDRFAGAAPAARREAELRTAHANEAYRTLKQPLLRAQHLLDLRGIVALDPARAAAPAFLMQQMEWREALAEARAARDTLALQRLATTVRASAATLQERLAVQLDTTPDEVAAATSVQQLAFLEKLLAAIDDALAALED